MAGGIVGQDADRLFGEVPMRGRRRWARLASVEVAVARDELEALVTEFRHVREEHRRTDEGSSVRRHLRDRLAELEADLERLLEEWVDDGDARRAWREHLHGDASEPNVPTVRPALVYRGCSESGSTVEVRERAEGGYGVEIDGCLVERIEGELDFVGRRSPHALSLAGISFNETFGVSRRALEALSEFVAESDPFPPWPSAAELAADGLVDRHFALTPRGQRALAARGERRP
jgi:hypothetical protein